MSFYMYVPVLVRSGSAIKRLPPPPEADVENKKQQARDDRKETPYAIPTFEERLARRSKRLKIKSNAEKFVENKLMFQVPKLNRKESKMET